MSATQVPLRPIAKGALTKLWLAILALVLIGVGLAWAGTAPLQGDMTESGVFVRTIAEGEGEPITANDGAFVIYTGKLADGTVFDSSNGTPIPMLPEGTIDGFREALLTMREGGKYAIRIPADQAYGDTPPPNSALPPGADLYFDIEIAQVVRDAALMARQAPQLPPSGELPTPPSGE